MEHLIQIVLAVFASTGFWAFVTAVWSEMQRKKSVERRALLGILHEELSTRCEKYINDKKITFDQYDDLRRYIFEPYKELGGNGTAEKLMEEVGRLLAAGEGKK